MPNRLSRRHSPSAGVLTALQEPLESSAYLLGGSDGSSPGQLVGDFLRGVSSTQLGEVIPSYKHWRAAGRFGPAGLRQRRRVHRY